jgi:hypothetical protein
MGFFFFFKKISFKKDEPHVIPIQYIGVQYCEQAKMSMNEVLLYALANADDNGYGHKGGYAIIHGAQPIPDLPGAKKSFDALAAAYPALWPYGEGYIMTTNCGRLVFRNTFIGHCNITISVSDASFISFRGLQHSTKAISLVVCEN